ncbi:MAG TPA: hypothetical protein VIM11_17830 [Tepidisphaeraceae bacterium]|jgi:hypothetical protein
MTITKSDGFFPRILFWAVIAGGFTAMVVQYSFAHGKLLCPPFYDDVSYFEDALHRLDVYYTSGAGALIKDYVASPPHSFFSSTLAMGAFATLGTHDWAPYVFNGLAILGLLIFIDYLLSDLALALRVCVMAVVLCVPICMQAVYQFRPDVPSAMCAAMGVALLFRQPLTRASRASVGAAGALLGLALLFKPPTCPLTGAVLLVSLALATLMDWILARPSWRAIGRAWLAFLVPAILIPLPHYLLTWRETYAYIYQPVFGQTHDLWARQGSIGWHLLYYVNGEGGRAMLGRMLWILVTVNLTGMVVLALYKEREALAQLLGLLAVAAVAWAGPTKIDVKQEYFGTTFQWLLVFAAVHALHMLLRNRGPVPLVVLAAVMFVSFRAFRFTPHEYDRGSEIVVSRNRLINDVYASLAAQHFPSYARIYLASTGSLNAGVLDYYSRRDTLHALNAGDTTFSDDLKLHAEGINCADYVIASESDNGEAWTGFVRSGNVQDQTLALVRSNPDFRQLASFPTRKGKHYYLFARTKPFFGWLRAQGLVESPAPHHPGLPFAYEATSPSSTLIISGDGSYDKLRLVIRANSHGTPRSLTVRYRGRKIAKWKLTASGQFEAFSVPFTLKEGGEHRIELTYDPAPDATHPIVFGQLEFPPDDLR